MAGILFLHAIVSTSQSNLFSNIFTNCTSNIMVWAYKTSLSLPLLKCLYQVRKMSDHVYECWVSMLPVSTIGY